MKRKTTRGFACAALATAATMFLTAPAEARVRIGGYSFYANGQLDRSFTYAGPCPVALKFDFGIIGTEGGPVQYTFTRSDGGHLTQQRSLVLPAPNRSMPVYDEWRLGANTPAFADYQGWVQIDILAPNQASQRIPFTLHCG